MRHLFMDIIALGIMLAAFIVMAISLIYSASNGYVLSINCNRYHEAIIEIVGVSLCIPFVFWRLKSTLRGECNERQVYHPAG